MATSQGGMPVSGSSGANPALMSWTERLAYNSAHADFCETNYEHSAYIVEWWNTWTSLMFALLGVAGLLMSSRLKLPARFMVLYILLAVRVSLRMVAALVSHLTRDLRSAGLRSGIDVLPCNPVVRRPT